MTPNDIMRAWGDDSADDAHDWLDDGDGEEYVPPTAEEVREFMEEMRAAEVPPERPSHGGGRPPPARQRHHQQACRRTASRRDGTAQRRDAGPLMAGTHGSSNRGSKAGI